MKKSPGQNPDLTLNPILFSASPCCYPLAWERGWMHDQTTWMQDAQGSHLQGDQLPQVHISTPDQTLNSILQDHPNLARPTLASIRAPHPLLLRGLQGGPQGNSRGPPGEITWASRGKCVCPQGKSRGPPGAITWAPRGNHVGPQGFIKSDHIHEKCLPQVCSETTPKTVPGELLLSKNYRHPSL